MRLREEEPGLSGPKIAKASCGAFTGCGQAYDCRTQTESIKRKVTLLGENPAALNSAQVTGSTHHKNVKTDARYYEAVIAVDLGKILESELG